MIMYMKEDFEKVQKNELIDTEMLCKDIQELRELSLTSVELNDKWNNLVKQWDDGFKLRLREKFGSTQAAQEVPAWQMLIGGTVEEEVSITDAQRDFILREVFDFFYNKLKPEIE